MSEQLRTAAQAALEALEEIMGDYDLGCGRVLARALRAALAEPQPQPEPVMIEAVAEVIETEEGLDLFWLIEGGICALTAGDVLMVSDKPITGDDGSGEVYAAPQTQQPLTDEQILSFGPGDPDAKWADEDQLYFARVIEAAHGIGGK